MKKTKQYSLRAAAWLLILCACLLSACGTRPGTQGGAGKDTTRADAGAETVPPLPSHYRWYTYENAAFAAPEEAFRVFTSGDSRNVLSLTGGDGAAQVYLRKCLPADTGTDKAYFDKLTAAAYGELFCDLNGISERTPVGTQSRTRAGLSYTVPGETDENTAVFRLYFVKDSEHGCIWLLKCRCTAASADEWLPLFDNMSRFIRTDADMSVPAV